MTPYDFDLFVVGAGSGGVRAARMAAAAGVRVGIAEQDRVGGTCVNLGCIPKKLYVYAAEYAATPENSAPFGWRMEARGFDWPTLRDGAANFIAAANKRMETMLEKAGVRLLRGRATLAGAHQVAVDGQRYTARNILLATGSQPALPAFPGREYLLTSDQMFGLQQLPNHLLVIGGGYIASEFAGIFHRFGVKVTQIYRGELFLRGFDREMRQFIAAHMRRQGIDLRFNTDVDKVVKNADDSFTVLLNNGETLTTSLVLAATGRRPRIRDLGLEMLGVELTPGGAVAVDGNYRSSIPSVYALGDAIDRLQLTPVALAQAMALVGHLYRDEQVTVDYDLVPTAVFSSPPLACVGLSEERARERYPQVDVFTTEFRALQQGLGDGPERMLLKLVVDGDSRRVIGAHMVGDGAAETIQGIAVALKAGATKAVFDQTVGIHPTNAEEFVTMRSVTRRHGNG